MFISAVSRELGSVRKLVKKGLEDNDYHAVEQDNFPPDYRQLIEKLRQRIASCDAMIHIAGHCYGAEPQQRPDGAPRRSYTQLEYDLAVELGKPAYVFLTADSFPTDPHDPEDEERTRLQAEHRHRVTNTGQDYSRPATREELDQKIRSLQLKVEVIHEELASVATNVNAAHQSVIQRIFASTLIVSVVVVCVGLLTSQNYTRSSSGLRSEIEKKNAEHLHDAREHIEPKIESVSSKPLGADSEYDLIIAQNLDLPIKIAVSTKNIEQRFPDGQTIPPFSIRCNQDVFLTVVTVDPTGKIVLLIPNRWVSEFKVLADQTVQIPDSSMGFELAAAAPHGLTLVRVIATKRPLQIRGVTEDLLQKQGLVELGQSRAVVLRDKLKAGLQPTTVDEEFTNKKLNELFEADEWASSDWTFITYAKSIVE